MSQAPMGETKPQRLPDQASEGMPVVDRDGQAVGIVQMVYFGGASDEAIAKQLSSRDATSNDEDERHWSAFDVDGVPDKLRVRLMRNGYLRVDGPGLMGGMRYVIPEQVQGMVAGTAVQLRLSREELLNLPAVSDASASEAGEA